jgi:hypothetical protein
MAIDFKHIDTDFMADYIEKNAPQDKQWFLSVAYDMRKKKKAIDKLDADGKPIYKQAKDKDGNFKFNPDGSPKMIKAKEYIDIENSEEQPVYNLLKAKMAFCEKYMPDLLPAPDKKKKPTDRFNGWK